MAANPTFTSKGVVASAVVSAANTNRDGTGTIVTVATGVAAGTRINEINIKATATTTAGMVRLWTSTDAGTTWRLYDEIPVAAITPSATLQSFGASRFPANLVLPDVSGRLGVTTHNAEAFHVIALGGDLT